MQTSFCLFAYFLHVDESIFLDMGSWWSWSVDISIRPRGRSSALWKRRSCFLVCSGNHRKTNLVYFGHRLFLSIPSKSCRKCLKCRVLFSSFISWTLSPYENCNNSHDLAQSHSTFPMNAYCFCSHPLLNGLPSILCFPFLLLILLG